MARDFYAVLGVPRNATEEQIRQRFRELARERHPDRFQGAEKQQAEIEFQEITQAFNMLSDPERRRQHDLELARPRTPTARSAAARRASTCSAASRPTRRRTSSRRPTTSTAPPRPIPPTRQAWHHLALACSQQPSWLPRAVAADRAGLRARADERRPTTSWPGASARSPGRPSAPSTTTARRSSGATTTPRSGGRWRSWTEAPPRPRRGACSEKAG